MDPQQQPQDPMSMGTKTGDDEAMGGMDDNMSTTPTGNYNSTYQNPPQHSDSHPSNGTFSPSENDPNARYASTNQGYPQQPVQPYSRPSSGLSGSGHHGYSQNYQEQSQRAAQPGAQSSVVIKVGMVGDAQIGKTSLMVKYVEGSWDEDYIQTLGEIL